MEVSLSPCCRCSFDTMWFPLSENRKETKRASGRFSYNAYHYCCDSCHSSCRVCTTVEDHSILTSYSLHFTTHCRFQYSPTKLVEVDNLVYSNFILNFFITTKIHSKQICHFPFQNTNYHDKIHIYKHWLERKKLNEEKSNNLVSSICHLHSIGSSIIV